MRRMPTLAMSISVAAIVAAAAPLPVASFSQVPGGLWEITGAPGAAGATRQCIALVAQLAQFEHRGRNCARRIVSERPGRSIVSYSCGPGDFGQSEIDVLTPRSLRISTQGISGQMPFNYVLQAHRVGDCTVSR